MFQPSPEPGRTGGVLASPDDFLLVAVQVASARAAGGRHGPGNRTGGTECEHRGHDAGNHVACLLDHHRVPLPQILPREILGVVEGRHRDRGAGDEHRLEHRVRRVRTRAAHVDVDPQQFRVRLLRGELEGGRPAGELGRGAQALAKAQVVDLDHDPVGVEIELQARVGPCAAERDHVLDTGTVLMMRLHRQPPGRHGCKRLAVALWAVAIRHHELVREGCQPAPRHQCRIQVPHRACRGIARVREERLPFRFPFGVHPRERRARKEHFAAHLHTSRGPVPQHQRDRADRPDVGGHVFPTAAVAAGGSPHERPPFVGQRDAEPVDLELGHVRDGGVAEPGSLPDPFVERPQVRLVIGIVEAEHRREVRNGGKAVGWTAGYPLGGGIRRDQIGMLRFEPLELVQQPIEGLVRHLRAVVDVVLLFVVPDLLAQLREAGKRVTHPRGAYRSRAST